MLDNFQTNKADLAEAGGTPGGSQVNIHPCVKARIGAFVAALAAIAGPLLMTLATPAQAGAIRALTSAPAVGARASMFGRLVTGERHTCVLGGDGAVRCWGDNVYGQLGDGTTQPRSLPVTVPGITTAVTIGAGGGSTCALMVNGTVRCWGDNGLGQLGDGSRTARLQPVTVSGLTDAVALAVGYQHACAIRAGGTLVCWGRNAFGQIGDGSFADRLLPTAVAGISGVRSVSAGAIHTCALLADGTVRCWGDNQFGQLGRGDTQPTTAKSTVSNLNRVAALSSGGLLSCAVQADGQVQCWGSAVNATVPTPVTGLADAVAIATGTQHACAVRVNGSTVCWGSNGSGQLGSGSYTASATPIDVSGISNVVVVAAGDAHTCALRAGGRVLCWGLNSSGQLGDGLTASTPTAVNSGYFRSTTATHLGTSGDHTCAVRANGAAACWGDNAFAKSGGFDVDIASPGVVDPAQNYLKIAAGGNHSCGLRADGAVFCWGIAGRRGDGVPPRNPDERRPVSVIGITTAIDIEVGFDHSCALLANGTAQCWGMQRAGELGNSQEQGNSSVPVSVSNLADAVELATGTYNTCARGANGTVQCWGLATDGRLGDGTNAGSRTAPSSVVSNLANAVAIDAGDGHACALRADGLVRCWGLNTSGQLGGGTTSPSTLPVAVAAITAANAISAGGAHSCVQLASGQARCWGRNDFGQLGDGTTTTPRLSPVAPSRQVTATFNGRTSTSVQPLDTLVAIHAGGNHTCSLATYGAPWCWGRNNEGQAGTGAFTASSDYAREVASFRFNVFPSVTVRRPGRIATITALLTCEEGQDAVVELKLAQGDTIARAQRRVSCLNGMESYPVDAPIIGRAALNDGPALVEADVVIYDRGEPLEQQSWTRQVTVTRQY